jgi:hypothetical protein
MKNLLFSLFLYVLLILTSHQLNAQSQILDDTTQQLYGTNTTFIFKEIDILDDTQKMSKLDTTLDNFHNFTIVQKTGYQFQDMGSWGTALRPLYFEIPHQIGARVGIDAHRPFLFTPDNVQYYDTKSPFLHFNYVQGTTGDQKIDFTYSRNVHKRFSFGMDYRRLNANKIYGALTQREILTDQSALVIHSQYESKNKKYRLLFHYSHLNQIVNEQGGVLKNGALTPDSGLYSYRDVVGKLGNSARSWQTHNNFHIYQQYKIGEGLVGFVITDLNRQRDAYSDIFPQDSSSNAIRSLYYPNAGVFNNKAKYNFNDFETYEGTIYWQLDNKFGWKGKWKSFNYQAYYKIRYFNWYLKENTPNFIREFDAGGNVTNIISIDNALPNGLQNFIGGKLFLTLKDSLRLTLEAEHLLGRDYHLQANFTSQWFNLWGRSMLYSPSLLEQKYVSNHFLWKNNFTNVFLNEIKAEAFFKNNFLTIKPFFNYQVIGNFIYFDKKALPQQTSDIIQMTRLGGNLSLKLGKWKTIQEVNYFENLGSNIFRAPQISYWGRIYCEDCLYKSKIQSQFGWEAHYKTDYLANAYMPVTKTFFLQDARLVQGFWLLEAFGSVKIKTFRIFGKFSNLLNFDRNAGISYETTPNYPGMPFTFTFGISWMFFD